MGVACYGIGEEESMRFGMSCLASKRLNVAATMSSPTSLTLNSVYLVVSFRGSLTPLWVKL